MSTPEARFAREAAQRAAHLCLAVQREMLGRAGRMDKAGREPVTLADFGAQAVICALLSQTFPGDRVVAEETGSDFERLAEGNHQARVAGLVGEALGTPATPQDVRRWLDHGREAPSSRVWMVDPIDGTKGFLRRQQFAVAIGLAVDSTLVAGALACPKLPVHDGVRDGEVGLVLSAGKGHGTTARPLAGGEGWPVRVSNTVSPHEARAVQSVEAAHGDPDATARALAALGVGQPPLLMDSQAKYAAVASGRAELYVRTLSAPGYRERVWDHAAGALIVSEAGGTVTDLVDKPLDFSLGTQLEANRGVLATNGHLHAATLAALREAGAA